MFDAKGAQNVQPTRRQTRRGGQLLPKHRTQSTQSAKRRSWATQLIDSIGCLLARSGSILRCAKIGSLYCRNASASCGPARPPLQSLLRGALAQLVRAPPCHGGGCGFEPRRLRRSSRKIGRTSWLVRHALPDGNVCGRSAAPARFHRPPEL